MFKKLLIFTAMAVVMMIEMPFAASAATTSKNAAVNKPQIRVQIGPQRHRRWRRDYDRDRDDYRFRENRGHYVMVPQYYWDDGYRRVRYVRVWRNY